MRVHTHVREAAGAHAGAPGQGGAEDEVCGPLLECPVTYSGASPVAAITARIERVRC